MCSSAYGSIYQSDGCVEPGILGEPLLFTDWKFFVFFGIVVSIYWLLRSNAWRKVFLLAASVFFYAMWDWRFLGLVALVTATTYAVTLLIPRRQASAQQLTILVVGMAVSLGVLGYFKYYNFFANSFADLVHTSHVNAALLLPVGISFYTFHSISYMVDTYRRRIEPSRSIIDVSLYILLFPQLVAGPIVRAPDLLPQMAQREPSLRPTSNISLLCS